MVEHYFGSDTLIAIEGAKPGMSAAEKKQMKQIKIDIYRTIPEVKIFAHPRIQTIMIRLLYIWSMRHPASGYVQGINDLVAPFILVFLTEYIDDLNVHNIYELTEKDIDDIEEQALDNIEADTYWCLSKVIDEIQDNYTELQPGIHKILNKMKKLIDQADSEALAYLNEMDIDFMDFAYRWVNCYLMREFNIYHIIFMWDTYFAEEDGFSQFHCYVCAALFLFFKNDIKTMNYQDTMLFLQNLPTKEWTEEDLSILMAKSFEMKELYHYNHRLHV